MKKKLLSILLVLAMLLGMLPAAAITASAAEEYTTVEVGTSEELYEALNAKGDSAIKLTADIDTFQGETGEYLIYGKKILDLNGHKLIITTSNYTGGDSPGCYTPEFETTYLFRVFGDLTINDSGKGGEIHYKSNFADDSSVLALWGLMHYTNVRVCNAFLVWGNLVINGGNIYAGDVQREWIMNGLKNVDEADWGNNHSWNYGDPFEIGVMDIAGDVYDGNARQIVWGSAAVVKDGGTLTVNGGTLSGRGQGLATLTSYGWSSHGFVNDEAVDIEAGGKVIVNGGSIIGNSGADVFAGAGVADGLKINGGFFKTDKHDNIRWLDAPGVLEWTHVYGNTDTVSEIIFTGSYGDMGIPDSAWKDNLGRIKVILNDTSYTDYNTLNTLLSLNETGGQTSGKSLEVTIMPVVNKPALTYLTGGPYYNSIAGENQNVKWNARSNDELNVKVDYTPFYKDTTGLENYSVTYNWRVYGSNVGSSRVEVDETFTTTTNTARVLVEAGWDCYFTGNLKVTCTVIETADNLPSSGKLQTEAIPFYVDATKTPLDATALPNDKMDTYFTYPGGSSGNNPVVITTDPLATELAKDDSGCKVEYQYSFRSWKGETITDYSYTGKLESHGFDYGHVKVSTTMIVYGSDGMGRRFTDEAWALVLPEIVPGGGTWDSAKTVYTGDPDAGVTLNIPLDTVNAQAINHRFSKGDLYGWYKITYDLYGAQEYTNIGNYGDTMKITEEGTYCYRAMDRDGNYVYSEPINVVFDADAYSISVTKSSNRPYWIYEDGTTLYGDTVLTATGSESVTRTMVYWRVVNYPEGAEDYVLKDLLINYKYSFTKNVSDFFDKNKLEEIVPGNYTVQAFVKSGGQYITASNPVTIEVRRRAAGADILRATGEVVSGEIIEGPYVGETMRLSCMPENGASNPVYDKGITWTVETLVGENVATVDNNGVLTAHNPGQVKITAKAGYAASKFTMYHTQSVTINIPITEFEVTLGTPTLGGDPDSIPSVPADAPYELDYNGENNWSTGVNNGAFYANGIPQLYVYLVPKEGYVFPAAQTYLLEYYDESWFTYADDCYITVNGTRYKFTDLDKTYTGGYAWEGDGYGTFYEPQEIRFVWTWDRLRSVNDKYLDYVSLSVATPEVGSVKDTSAFELASSSNAYISTYSYIGSVYKVSGDNLNDDDINNDNAQNMASGETYQQGQMYRVTIMVNAGGAYTSPAQYFEEQVTAIVNNESCIITPLSGSSLEGDHMACVYYYFMPTAPIQTMHQLWVSGISTPEAYRQPPRAEDITEISSNFDPGDEVYVSHMQWFYDINNNNVIDEGEDSPELFNADGSFLAGLSYSVYMEFEARDRDDDGVGDYVKFDESTPVCLNDMGVWMEGDHKGATYKFGPAVIPEIGMTADPVRLEWSFYEGYHVVQQSVYMTSVGTTPVTSFEAQAEDSELITVEVEGNNIYVVPASGLTEGVYRTTIYVVDNYGVIIHEIPVSISVEKNDLEFTLQPVGGETADDEPLTVTWETSFTPLRQEIWNCDANGYLDYYQNLAGDLRSYPVYADEDEGGYYFIRSYYGTHDEEYVDSNRFYVTEKADDFAFTTQPHSGSVAKTQKYTFTWALNKAETTCVLQVYYPEGDTWMSQDDLTGQNSFSVGFVEPWSADGVIKYRLFAHTATEEIYSDEFTVTWTGSAVITEVNAKVTAPSIGAAPATTATTTGTDYTVSVLQWMEDKTTFDETSLDGFFTGASFEENVMYAVVVRFTAKEGNVFAAEPTVIINGKTAHLFSYRLDGTEITYYVKFAKLTEGGGLLGDVNGDGSVNAMDSYLLKTFNAGVNEPTADESLRADVNGDGQINAMDSYVLKLILAGLYVG